MGEIPKSIMVSYSDDAADDEYMYLYGCEECNINFAVGMELSQEKPFCPGCGKRENVILLEELT